MSFEEMAESAKSAGLPTEFKFDESCVRTVIKDGEPWFVAKDVCEILDLEDPSMTVSRLEEDQRGKANVCTTAGQRELLTVSESGLYSLIFTSRKPEAKRFRKWIASEVLPSIRKTGGYQIPEGGFIGLKGDEVDYERWLLERALLDAQIIAIEMQRIGVHFLQQMTDDPEMGAARANQNLDEFHDAVRDNMQRSHHLPRSRAARHAVDPHQEVEAPRPSRPRRGSWPRTRRRRSALPRRRLPFSVRAVRRQTSRQAFPDRRFMFMAAATPRETLDASLTRIADDLIGLRETVDKMDHAQDALLVNGNSLQGQVETLSSLIAHMIEVLTPERPEQEGPSLADLLSRLIAQQSALAGLMRQTLEIVTRLDPTVSAAANGAPANGAGRA